MQQYRIRFNNTQDNANITDMRLFASCMMSWDFDEIKIINKSNTCHESIVEAKVRSKDDEDAKLLVNRILFESRQDLKNIEMYKDLKKINITEDEHMEFVNHMMDSFNSEMRDYYSCYMASSNEEIPF